MTFVSFARRLPVLGCVLVLFTVTASSVHVASARAAGSGGAAPGIGTGVLPSGPPDSSGGAGSERSAPPGGSAGTSGGAGIDAAPLRSHSRRPVRDGETGTGHHPPAASSPSAAGIPSTYLRLYRAASRRYGGDWRVLAAIGYQESDHGRSGARGVTAGLNSARCCAGPMQMCAVRACGDVWHAYALDANGDGAASIYDPADAIFAAGALLRDLRARFGSHPELLLAAYNAGPGAVAHYHGVPPYPETKAYVRSGLRYIAAR